jgi:hypothetical protein
MRRRAPVPASVGKEVMTRAEDNVRFDCSTIGIPRHRPS